MSLSRGLAVPGNQARELAFLANLETEQRIKNNVFPPVGCLTIQENPQGAGSSGIIMRRASKGGSFAFSDLCGQKAPTSKTHVIRDW